jgi:hypothetical protein
MHRQAGDALHRNAGAGLARATNALIFFVQ